MRNLLVLIILLLLAPSLWAKNIRFPEMYIQFESLEADAPLMTRIFDEDVSLLQNDLKKKNGGVNIKLNIIGLKRAQKLFKTLQSKKKIPFDYAPDGCYARAHRMALMAQRRGIILGKVFIQGRLDPFPKDGWLWRYHVAPVIAVKDGTAVKLMVIDPSLFKGLVNITEWSKKTIGSEDQTAFSIVLRNRFAYDFDDIWGSPKRLFSIWDLLNTSSVLREYRGRL